MEIPGKRHTWTQNFKRNGWQSVSASSNQNIVEQLKKNAKNKNTLKATQTWETMEVFYEVRRAKVAWWSNFHENIINKTSYEPARALMVTRDVLKVLNLQTTTRAHKSRNVLAFIRFCILIDRMDANYIFYDISLCTRLIYSKK